ncbi:IclR family transcriptional regulator [Senegalia massiliensis]|uniref:IclR family transcriptional regulator n=1 Tax=Senegalia massiliensis TaxID=1720316 RepID=UPI001030C180|nr:IclR family transcriptional regulator [Senegalia massiliensis]
MKTKGKTVQSVDRALKIIEILKDRPKGIGVTELSNILEVSKSTAHRLLMSLYNADFVRQDRENEKYLLGLRFIELGEIVSNELDIKEIVYPYLHKLGNVTGETAHLAIKNKNEIIYIDKIESPKTIRMFSTIGKRAPLYCTGVGKAIFAFLPESEIINIIDSIDFVKYTENTIVTKKEMLKELENIRNSRYAIDDEEHELGIKCAAAPILNYNNEVVAGISVASPIMRLNDEKFNNIIKEVLNASKSISNALGYNVNTL